VYVAQRVANITGGTLADVVLGKEHQWFVIVYPDGTTYSAGMGNAQGAPGQNGQTSPDYPYSATSVQNHSAQPMVNMQIVPRANAATLRGQLEFGTPTGPWVPGINDCNTFVNEKIQQSSPATTPPPWTQVPAALSPSYQQQLYRAWFDPDYDGGP